MHFVLTELPRAPEHGRFGCTHSHAEMYIHIYIEGYLRVFFLNLPSDSRPTGFFANVTTNSK